MDCPAIDPGDLLSSPLTRRMCRSEPGNFDWLAYGVRYWRDGVLLLQRGWPVDPDLHDQVREALVWDLPLCPNE